MIKHMQDLLAEDEEENPQKTGYFLCVVVELKPTATHQERWVLIKADHKNLHLSLTAFNSREMKLISNLWPVCFAGSRSKSPEDSMEVEGIDDWKMPRRNIARNYPWQAWSSEVDSQMWTRSCLCIYCPLVGARPEVTQCDTSTTQTVQLCSAKTQEQTKMQPIFTISRVFPWEGKVFHWNRECQFQSLNPTHHGNAAATDEGPGVQGHRCSQRGVQRGKNRFSSMNTVFFFFKIKFFCSISLFNYVGKYLNWWFLIFQSPEICLM